MIVAADKKALEWRVALELSRDETGLKEIHDELVDIHSANQRHFNIPDGPTGREGRLAAKIFLFRTIFRGSAYAFSKDELFSWISSSPKYWERLIEQFFQKYDGLDAWHQELAKLSAQRKPYKSFTGRTWLVPPFITPTGETKLLWSSFTNFPVQGTGADIVKLTRIGIHSRLRKHKMKAGLINTIHDANYIDSPESEAKACVNILYEASDDIPNLVKQYFNHELALPFPCEAKWGPNVGALEKVERFA